MAGQESGVVWAHDVDKKGAVVWKVQLVDTLATGEKTCFRPEDNSHSSIQLHGQTAAVSAIPGVVFSADGMLRAYATDDGRQLWQYDTAHEFTTVNAVPAKGGSMGAAAPGVAGRRCSLPVPATSSAPERPGNVLLVLGVNQRIGEV